MASKGMISRAKEKTARTDLKGHIGLKAYELVRPGENGSIGLNVILDDIEPGGRIDPHYHQMTPVCDHAYYVISGDIMASVGDHTERVGAETLIYFPTDVVHAIVNVGKGTAKVLLIGTANPGKAGGSSVFVKA